MKRIEPEDIERLEERITAVIEHLESKSGLNYDTLRDFLRVGEIKVCTEFICTYIADDEIELDSNYERELVQSWGQGHNQCITILKKLQIMSVFAKIECGSEYASLILDAVELPDLKLKCEITCEPRVETLSGEVYAAELIRILCSDGMRTARRKLSIANGLQITVSEINGTLERNDEIAVCHVAELAIARALDKDDSSLIASMPDWTVTN